MKTLYGVPSVQMLVVSLLSLLVLSTNVGAAELGISAGASSGAYASRFDNFVGEATARTDNRKWELAVGYIAEQLDACDFDCDKVDPYGYASVTRIVFFPLAYDVNIVMGLGLMAATETNPLLSRATNLSVQAGLEIKRIRIQFRHFSNGGTKTPNYGQNMLLIGVGF